MSCFLFKNILLLLPRKYYNNITCSINNCFNCR